MKTGFIFNHATIIGGGEISFIDLIAALRHCGVDPVAFVPGRGEIEERMTAMDVPVTLTDFPRLSLPNLLFLPGRVLLLARIFSGTGIDLLHVNGARCMLYAGPAAKRAGIPCVWHNRVLVRDRVLDRIRGHYADAVIANSSAVKAALGRIGVRNAEVCYNGFDTDAIARQEALDIHRHFQVAPGTPVILAVGRLSPWKGFSDLLEACAILNARKVPFFCLIVGKSLPHERSHIEALLTVKEKLKLGNVHFTGWRTDVAALMKGATVLAVPSHGEPFGRIIIEAWACGLPVVATGAGGPAELIHSCENGSLVPLKDPPALATAIEDLLVHPGKRAAFAEAGKLCAKRFSLTGHAEAVVRIYRRLLEKKPDRSHTR